MSEYIHCQDRYPDLTDEAIESLIVKLPDQELAKIANNDKNFALRALAGAAWIEFQNAAMRAAIVVNIRDGKIKTYSHGMLHPALYTLAAFVKWHMILHRAAPRDHAAPQLLDWSHLCGLCLCYGMYCESCLMDNELHSSGVSICEYVSENSCGSLPAEKDAALAREVIGSLEKVAVEVYGSVWVHNVISWAKDNAHKTGVIINENLGLYLAAHELFG